ncbi:MAG: 4-hydroxythreonine-4-phosphate dehydrogenase PdxA [Kiritimatiellia bacterium]|jgi:4-hydroxythreonine-4-phosphate dehydrogenase|nr:4-hydroxythreonine-4-phosphate dehydrogenase PdxA [Kiritimatiellia bacterium]
MADARIRCALTLGDAAGVGPELVLRALADEELSRACQLLVYGNRVLLDRVAAASGIPFPAPVRTLGAAEEPLPQDGHVLFDLPFPEADVITPGTVQAACGRQAYEWVRRATLDITRHQTAHALVTAPLNKSALHAAGVRAVGHTEILSELTMTPDPRMLFHAPAFCVCLATIHEPLARVPGLLTVPGLLRTLRLTHEACRAFGTPAPRLGVLALNPHAGENGLLGTEERRILMPALETARAEGILASGPLVADTAFTWLLSHPPHAAPYDAYVAMYHDQGLIPFKIAAFDQGVNVTLGLPILRTSPDHGTAFDRSWQGTASPASLFSAIRLAVRMARSRIPLSPSVSRSR